MDQKEQSYFLIDVTRDTWRVCKLMIGPALVNVILFAVLVVAIELIKLETESSLTLNAANLIKNICTIALSIWLIIKSYSLLKEDKDASYEVLDTVKSKMVSYFLSDLIVSIIVGFIIMVIGVFTIGLSFAFKSGIGTLISSLIILGVGIYYAIKYAFVGQAVVIGQVNYMDALNESDRFSKGYGGTIIGIAIFPVLVAFLPTYIFPLLDMFSEITLVIILAVISGFIHLYANVATSVLYMYIRKEHASIYTQEEIEECALIEQ